MEYPPVVAGVKFVQNLRERSDLQDELKVAGLALGNECDVVGARHCAR